MAHKKGQGSSKNGRNSNPQYRGIKLYGGESAKPGAIIVRQCGTKFHPGFNVERGKDDTLYSVASGRVVFQNNKVHVDPFEENTPRPQWLREYRAKQAAKNN
ncbi:MAG: 50S ribosomal protein L27 [Planctomycetota bacterium]|nr:MAG: 50S ribosomal protein L27 [Planctomycetota bacterium]